MEDREYNNFTKKFTLIFESIINELWSEPNLSVESRKIKGLLKLASQLPVISFSQNRTHGVHIYLRINEREVPFNSLSSGESSRVKATLDLSMKYFYYLRSIESIGDLSFAERTGVALEDIELIKNFNANAYFRNYSKLIAGFPELLSERDYFPYKLV